MLRLVTLFIVLLTRPSIAYPQEDPNLGCNLLPLALGNTWKYVAYQRTRDRGEISNTAVWKITNFKHLDGQAVFEVEYATADGSVMLQEDTGCVEQQLICFKRFIYKVAERGLVHGTREIYKAGDVIKQEDLGTPEVILDLPLTTGKHWVSQGTYYSVVGKVQVKVPAGLFDCWKVKLFFEGEEGFIYKYYAEHVGLVKEETHRFGKQAIPGVMNPGVLELLEYQLKEPEGAHGDKSQY